MESLTSKILVLCCIILLGGCSANMIISPQSPYGPVEGDKIGMVRYLAEGASPVIEARQKDAFKKMYDACDGRYKILNSSPQDKLVGISSYDSDGGSSYLGSSQYVYIKFQCLD